VLLALAIPADVDAQQVESVTVEASRMASDTVGFSASGIPVKAISLAYKVKLSDIDLTAPDAPALLEKRVRAAALAACHDLSRTYPVSEPNDSACAREATDKAMKQVEGLLAAAVQAKP
jgi:UrcA family protein